MRILLILLLSSICYADGFQTFTDSKGVIDTLILENTIRKIDRGLNKVQGDYTTHTIFKSSMTEVENKYFRKTGGVISGFTSLGTGNTGIKIKTISGTTAAAEGGGTAIAHGVTSSGIISVTANVFYSAGNAITPGYTFSAGYQFDVAFDGSNVSVYNHATNSENILSKTVYVTVIYTID